MGDTAVNSILLTLHQSNENGNIKISPLFFLKKTLFWLCPVEESGDNDTTQSGIELI